MPIGTAVVSPAANEGSMAEKNNNSYIPEDIIIEILKHLSLKSLAKSNCVSKLWQTLISSKHVSSQTAISAPLQYGFFFQSSTIFKNRDSPIHVFPSSPNFPKTHFTNLQILASSNGLILCGRPNKNPIVHYSVWNATSNRLISIPKPLNRFTSVKIGFHSHDSDSFTILRFGKLRPRPIEIYSSETGEWRRLSFDLDMDSWFLPFEGPAAAVLNGVFYWLEFGSMIYAFNLFKNEFMEVGLPVEETEYRRNVVSRCLAVAGGEVVAASTDGVVVEVWVLKERDLWGLKGRFSVEGLVGINANTLRASPAAAAATADRRWLVEIVGFPASDSERIYLATAECVVCCGIGSGELETVHRFDRSLECTDGSSSFVYFPCYSF